MGFAPTLRGFEPIAGGWKMVIMDVIGGGYCELKSPTPALLDKIKDKLVRLHQEGYVHGDVRDVNIMVEQNGSDFMLLDFDWAGKITKVRYPPNVYIGHGLWRPEGAYDGELIKADHDLQMLDALFRPTDTSTQ
jgi:serine/threonine protein kinase